MHAGILFLDPYVLSLKKEEKKQQQEQIISFHLNRIEFIASRRVEYYDE